MTDKQAIASNRMDVLVHLFEGGSYEVAELSMGFTDGTILLTRTDSVGRHALLVTELDPKGQPVRSAVASYCQIEAAIHEWESARCFVQTFLGWEIADLVF